jgi:glutamine---fructose-6-phosphate transaminase (isomerizing)
MCGIVGYVGSRPVVDILIRGLRRLEYRGYDSAGVAFFQNGDLQIRKSEGKLENVERLLSAERVGPGVTSGMGHTRWATHGKPTTQNAHPHRAGPVVLVHNGIIENYQEIKRELLAKGVKPESETDSELYGHLVAGLLESGRPFLDAVREAFQRLQGQCSVVVMSQRDPDVVVGIRNGSPLVAARDPQGGAAVASDAQPLLELTQDVVFLEHGDVAIATRDGLRFASLADGSPIQRASTRIDWSVEKLDKGGFPHYMLKEIHEQPAALVDTLNVLLDRARTEPFPLAAQPGTEILKAAREMVLVACGTSWHAACLAKYWLERWARVPVSVELASEFRYREPVVGPGTVIVGISQSGETADTLAVLREARRLKIPTLGITNVRGSSISREADAVFYTSAGPEIAVAGTKTFTTQMLTLLAFAGYLGRERKTEGIRELFDGMLRLPHLLTAALDPQGELVSATRAAARAVAGSRGFFFIGRGTSFPVALEGALKLKEIAYIHAEGYAAGELKHGPIAMIDKGMTVVVLAPRDPWREKTMSNLEEVKARGAVILGVGEKGDDSLRGLCDHWVPVLPLAATAAVTASLMPFMLTPVMQLLSYELATLKGTDIDKPRNLAKSVTVE